MAERDIDDAEFVLSQCVARGLSSCVPAIDSLP